MGAAGWGLCIGSSGSTRSLQDSAARATRGVSGFTVAAFLAVAMVPAYGEAVQWDVCNGCELLLGIGYTYHFWGETGGFVLPATLSLDQGRYEVGVFRMTSDQTLYETLWGKSRVLARPYWGASASRRWQLAARPSWRLFFGFGASYKTEEDVLNATHWNFAEQLCVRLHHVLGEGSDMEFAIRHWSNAGLRTPNRGQDFMTVTIAF
jgi:Lipid A 3-O-deacylase (PagL)